MSAGDVRAQVARATAGEQHSVHDRVKRLRLDRAGQRERGDRFGGRVGLLGGDAAVLEREVGGVAGGVHALDAAHLAVRVDRDEPVLGGRQPAHGGAVELGQRDHAIDLQAAVVGAHRDRVPARHLGVGGGDHADARVGEQLGHGVACAGAEDRKRRLLGCDDRDRQRHAALERAPGGHQRELVHRQLPAHPRRDHEREPLHEPAFDVLQQAVQDVVELAVVDRVGVLVAAVDACAQREQQRVVWQLLAVVGVGDARAGIDPREAVLQQLHADLRGQLAQRVAPRAAVGERFAHGHRAVHELGVGRQHRERCVLAGEIAQRERALQSAHAATGDQHFEGGGVGHGASIWKARRRGSRVSPLLGCRELRSGVDAREVSLGSSARRGGAPSQRMRAGPGVEASNSSAAGNVRDTRELQCFSTCR